MEEIIDTNFKSNFEKLEIPDGKNTFRITRFKKNGKMYIFTLTYNGDQEGEQVFFASNIGPLLKALGCKEAEKGLYIFDSDKVLGSAFKATVYRGENKKDPSKPYQNMKDFEGDIPF